MSRPEVKLDSQRFTSASALAREISALLEETPYKIIVIADSRAVEAIQQELWDRVVMGRVKIMELASE